MASAVLPDRAVHPLKNEFVLELHVTGKYCTLPVALKACVASGLCQNTKLFNLPCEIAFLINS